MADVKTINGVATANVKTINGVAIANAKTWNGVTFASSSYDADAQTFFTAVSGAGGSLSSTEMTAVNQLVLDLKAYSIWGQFHFIYPMVGGSAASCSINLKPAGNSLTFVGSPTITSTGVAWNGSTQYADTGYDPNNMFSGTSRGGLAVYLRNNTNTSGVDIGASTSGIGSAGQAYVMARNSSDVAYSAFCNAGPTSTANTDSRGMFSGNSQFSFNRLYFNGNWTGASTGGIDGFSNQTVYLGAMNNGGSASDFSDRECAFAAGYLDIGPSDQGNMYTAVQAFQTTLSRQV